MRTLAVRHLFFPLLILLSNPLLARDLFEFGNRQMTDELPDTLFDGFDLLETPVYVNSTYEDNPRILEPESLVSGAYPTRLAFNSDGSGEISRTLNSSVDSDVFSWEVTESASLLTLNLEYDSGGFTRRTLTTPSLGDSCGADNDDRQRDIDIYGAEYERLLAFVDQNPGPYIFEAACQIELHFWTEKITYEITSSENWQTVTYQRQALVLTQDLLDAGWDGPSTLVSVAPALSESTQYPRQYNDMDLTYSVFAEPTGKWLLPIYADPTGAGKLDDALMFSEEIALTQTDPEFSPAPNFGTGVSHWSGYDFDWELHEQALVLENQDLRLQYRVLDKQDDILLLEFDLTDKRSGEQFIVAERGAKFDGTGAESASKFQIEPPLYYQSLLNGKPSFIEIPGSCDWVNGALFVNQDGVYRFFMSELQDCRFLVSSGTLRDAEIIGNSLFMTSPEWSYSSLNRRREWRVVATLADDRLLIIESARFLDESLIEQGYDFFIKPRTIVAEVADLSLSGDAWLVLDIDRDGLTNREEEGLRTAYGQADSDADGLSDGNEVSLGTDPLVADSDADGLSDSEEITLGTNPLLRDTDGDGNSDKSEVASGTDPLDPESVPEDEGSGLPAWLMYWISEH